MEIGNILKKGWELFTKDALALIVGAILAAVLGGITLGILMGPLMAGVIMMPIKRMRDGTEAKIGDIFGYLNKTGAFILAIIVIAVPIGIAQAITAAAARYIHWSVGGILGLALLVAIVYIGVSLIYLAPSIVDANLGAIDAIKRSIALVAKGGFWKHFLILFVLGLLMGIASAIPFAGLIVGPIYFCCIGYMYLQMTGEAAAA